MSSSRREKSNGIMGNCREFVLLGKEPKHLYRQNPTFLHTAELVTTSDSLKGESIQGRVVS